ncbi:uncharacterized protein LOC119181351 [Rhipicephalus microplus]|uniref:uncharacterized protein LOC119181351 n=1 Tax=Rhipicephalus microplus TaxID=6941 RepID=UPI002F2B0F0E
MAWRTCAIALLCTALSCALADEMPGYAFTELCQNQSAPLTVRKAALVWLNSSQEECSVPIRFPSGLLVTVVSLNLTTSANCTNSYLSVMAGDEVVPGGGPFCGHREDSREATPSLQVAFLKPPENGSVMLNVNATSPSSNFTLVLTAFTNVSSDGSCPSTRHECYNKRCIASDIFCDGHNHCGGTQVPLPEQCPSPVTVEATWWAIGTIIFGVFALILLLPCFVWTALRGGQNNVTTLVLPGAMRIPSKNGSPSPAAAAGTSPTLEAPSVNDVPSSADHQLSVECAPTTSDKARLVTS